jgi:hypothetical protein
MTGPALLLLFVLLPLGPFLVEIGTEVALAAGLVAALGARRLRAPLAAPLLVLVAAAVAASLGRPPAHALEAARQVWGLALLFVVPLLWSAGPVWRHRAERAGLAAASIVALWGLGEAAWMLASGLHDPAVGGARGPFSHHLTLGYALLPPLARALHRRWWPVAALLAAGALSSLGLGPALSVAVVLAGVAVGPGRALVGGAVAVAGGIAALGWVAPDGELLQRAVLWTSAADVAVAHPAGVGPAGFRAAAALAQDRILPGFHFPLHAHDSALQAAATWGIGGWVALGLVAGRLWGIVGRSGRVAMAGIAVGACTQDILGDLEVVRALCAWALLDPPSAPRLAPIARPNAGRPIARGAAPIG